MPFNNWPPQYLAAFMKGGTPTKKHTLTITVTNGENIVTSIAEGGSRTVTITPNQGYLPPKTITTTHTIAYDKYTGALSVVMGTTDITMSAICDPIPHSYASMSAYKHNDLKEYNLTHNDLAGVY